MGYSHSTGQTHPHIQSLGKDGGSMPYFDREIQNHYNSLRTPRKPRIPRSRPTYYYYSL